VKNKRTLWRARGVLALIAIIGLAAAACEGDGPQAHDCARAGFCVWDDWQPGRPPGCIEDGTRTRTCGYCGSLQTGAEPALGHEWGDWEGHTLPFCTTEGREKRTCLVEGCGYEDFRPVPVLGHRWCEDGGDGWTLTEYPVHRVRPGTQERDCLREGCGEREPRSYPADPGFVCCVISCCLQRRGICLNFYCFDPEDCFCPDI